MRTCALVLVASAALGAEKPVLYRLPRSGETNLVDEAHFSLAESYASRGDLRAARTCDDVRLLAADVPG